jgi:hypothetical protein
MVSEHELIYRLKRWSFEKWVGTEQPHYIQLDRNT